MAEWLAVPEHSMMLLTLIMFLVILLLGLVVFLKFKAAKKENAVLWIESSFSLEGITELRMGGKTYKRIIDNQWARRARFCEGKKEGAVNDRPE